MLTLFLSRLAEKKSIIDYLLLDPAEKLRTNIMHTPSSYKSSVIRAPVPWKQSRVVAQQYCRQSSYKKVTRGVIQYTVQTLNDVLSQSTPLDQKGVD